MRLAPATVPAQVSGASYRRQDEPTQLLTDDLYVILDELNRVNVEFPFPVGLLGMQQCCIVAVDFVSLHTEVLQQLDVADTLVLYRRGIVRAVDIFSS